MLDFHSFVSLPSVLFPKTAQKCHLCTVIGVTGPGIESIGKIEQCFALHADSKYFLVVNSTMCSTDLEAWGKDVRKVGSSGGLPSASMVWLIWLCFLSMSNIMCLAESAALAVKRRQLHDLLPCQSFSAKRPQRWSMPVWIGHPTGSLKMKPMHPFGHQFDPVLECLSQ